MLGLGVSTIYIFLYIWIETTHQWISEQSQFIKLLLTGCVPHGDGVLFVVLVVDGACVIVEHRRDVDVGEHAIFVRYEETCFANHSVADHSDFVPMAVQT